MYSQSITRSHRTAFVLLIDRSGSMAQTLDYMGRTVSKAWMLADVANRLLMELIVRARRSEGVRDYYDVAVIGYSGDGVQPLLTDRRQGMISIAELAARPVDSCRICYDWLLPDGRHALRNVTTPRWILPHSVGATPMYEALCTAHDLLAHWCSQPEHAESFPPVVFNITDGESSDSDEADLCSVCDRIKALHTDDGAVLLINIHISASPEPASVIFPRLSEIENKNRYARLLFDCSSPMPGCFEHAIGELRGDGIRPPYRGMSYNASVAEMISILDIGTISVKVQ